MVFYGQRIFSEGFLYVLFLFLISCTGAKGECSNDISSCFVLFHFLDLPHHAALSTYYDRGLLCLLHPSYVFLISHVRFSLMT
jgi:hypothetical protein